MITKYKDFLLENINQHNEYIVYHSSDSVIKEFNFDDVELKANSSTNIDGIFFSDIPQKSWGGFTYKVKLVSKNPIIFDISKSRFDSIGVQEAFDALFRGETSYIIEDLLEYNSDYFIDSDDYEYDEEYEQAVSENTETVENMVQEWTKADLIIITNCNYAKHKTEYIVPEPYYNGNSAKMINLGLI